MALKKPSDFFGNNIEENNSELLIDTTSDGSLREELTKVESLSEQITQLQQELSQKVVQTDLEKLVISQINSMQENFSVLQNDFRTSNKKDISEFKEKVSELTDIVENILEVEIPKYKKQITKNQFNIGEKFDALQEVVEENIVGIKEELDIRLESVAEALDENLDYFNQQLQETSSEVKKTSDTYNKLSKIVESRISKENEKLEEYSETIKSLYESFVELQNSLKEEGIAQVQTIEDNFESISSDIKTKIDSIDEEVSNIKREVSSDISGIKADVVINEQHLKKVETYIQENYKQIVDLREEVFTEIEKLPVGDVQENIDRLEKKIDFIRETYSKIEPEVVVKEVIQEGLLNIPPDEKTSDPLSPLDKNYVTLDQLQEHYRLFINRIQQQLSTLGGGGEYRFRYLDGIVGIKTNSSAYDGKFLQWNSTTNQAEFVTVTGIGSTGTAQINSDWNATTGISSILNKPTIPAAQINSDWNSNSGISSILNKPTIPAAQINSDWNATTGISSILNKPTIVNQIVAGAGITISPSNGIGVVTINAQAAGVSSSLGYYGSFYDTTDQLTGGITSRNVVSIGQTAEAYAVRIIDGTKIKVDNSGVYNIQFSFQLSKTNASSDTIDIWIAKNGIDIPYTDSEVTIQGSQLKDIPAWNFVLSLSAGDYIEFYWSSSDPAMKLATLTAGTNPIHPVSPSVIVTVTQVASALVGSGTSTQTLNQTLGYGNTSSLGMSVGISTFGNNKVIIGGATTALLVNDNARITGILTLGTASIELVAQNEHLKIGSGVSIYSAGNAIYSGIITASDFFGNGSNLTGIVTTITAGIGITISPANGLGNVTINGIGVSIGNNPPSNTTAYPLWYDNNLGRGFVYYNDGNSSQWVDFCPPLNNPTSIKSITGVTTYYQAINTDDYIGVGATVPVTIVLPASPPVGKKIIIKDEGNKINTYNVTIQAGVGKSIENDTSVVMSINHQSLTCFFNGSNWYLV